MHPIWHGKNIVQEDLDIALKESTATWKFVIGHHAIRSVSIHGDTIELVEELLLVLKVIIGKQYNWWNTRRVWKSLKFDKSWIWKITTNCADSIFSRKAYKTSDIDFESK